jgi:hypothetical protein
MLEYKGKMTASVYGSQSKNGGLFNKVDFGPLRYFLPLVGCICADRSKDHPHAIATRWSVRE